MIVNAGALFAGGVKISIGTYVGTGTYGEGNPNSADVGFAPKVFFVYLDYNGTDGTEQAISPVSNTHGFWTEGSVGLKALSGTSYLGRPFTVSGSRVSWYLSYYPAENPMKPRYQLNESGKTYRWVAIG